MLAWSFCIRIGYSTHDGSIPIGCLRTRIMWPQLRGAEARASALPLPSAVLQSGGIRGRGSRWRGWDLSPQLINRLRPSLPAHRGPSPWFGLLQGLVRRQKMAATCEQGSLPHGCVRRGGVPTFGAVGSWHVMQSWRAREPPVSHLVGCSHAGLHSGRGSAAHAVQETLCSGKGWASGRRTLRRA